MVSISVLTSLVVGLAIYLHSLVKDQYQFNNFEYENTNKQALDNLQALNPDIIIEEIEIQFKSDDSTSYIIHSWLFLPQNANNLPIVLLSHGLGSQKDMGLSNYAMSFANAGYAALVFDYRYFGGSYELNSNNNKRNYINPWNHVKDIKNIVNYVSSGKLGNRINPNSIALWGTSFAGGHSIVVGSELQSKLKCIISQVPHLNGKEASKRGIKERGIIGTIKVAILVISDYLISELLGFPPVYIKIAGTTSDTAYMMLSEESLNLYFGKHPSIYLGNWKNLAPARTLGVMSFYNPINSAENISIPTLFVGASNDTLCPMEYIYQANKLISKSELVVVNGTHFDIYQGDGFTKSVEAMVTFLKKNLV